MSRITSLPIRLTAIFVATLTFASVQAAEDSAALELVREKIATMFDTIDPGDINGSPVDGWYTIHKGPIVAYISADGRYLLQGDMIDLDPSKDPVKLDCDVEVFDFSGHAPREHILDFIKENQ